MTKQRIIKYFPWLRTLRRRQRLICFYAGMRLDGNRYAERLEPELLPYRLFESACPLYNHKTGFDMIYQENKVFNLKLVADTMDGLLIRPGETFSFWHLARYADSKIPYKDGLTVIDGQLTTAEGGGLCQISNSLFWAFLHSPLTVVERHGHRVKEFPETNSDEIRGADATISEGWLDLKVRNNTECTYQIHVEFDDSNIIVALYCSEKPGFYYQVVNGSPTYYRKDGVTYEDIAVYRKRTGPDPEDIVDIRHLYTNRCIIKYPLPENTPVLYGEAREA